MRTSVCVLFSGLLFCHFSPIPLLSFSPQPTSHNYSVDETTEAIEINFGNKQKHSRTLKLFFSPANIQAGICMNVTLRNKRQNYRKQDSLTESTALTVALNYYLGRNHQHDLNRTLDDNGNYRFCTSRPGYCSKEVNSVISRLLHNLMSL